MPLLELRITEVVVPAILTVGLLRTGLRHIRSGRLVIILCHLSIARREVMGEDILLCTILEIRHESLCGIAPAFEVVDSAENRLLCDVNSQPDGFRLTGPLEH